MKKRPLAAQLPLLAVLAVALVVPRSIIFSPVILVFALPIGIWQLWVISRAIHVFRVVDWVAAKRYERSGRHKLPPEYRDTLFASAAARRRERQND